MYKEDQKQVLMQRFKVTDIRRIPILTMKSLNGKQSKCIHQIVLAEIKRSPSTPLIIKLHKVVQ